jgi:hypothetical protein
METAVPCGADRANGAPTFVWPLRGFVAAMRIVTIDTKDGSHQECGIEVPLRRLVASPNQLEAAYWRMMLDLVEYLAASGLEPVLRGNIFLKQIWLIRRPPPDPKRDQEFKEHMEKWKAANPDAQFGDAKSREKFLDEARKFAREPDVSVTLRVDWLDYAPLQDGIPQMHYHRNKTPRKKPHRRGTRPKPRRM